MEPRSFTRNSLSNILNFDLGKENTANENLWLALPVLFVAIFTTYQGLVNAFRALSDKPVRYALSIPFVR